MPRKRVVVLVSGGLDSATLLALAKHRGLEAHALTVDYGQRNRRAEIRSARRLARTLGVPHVVLDTGTFQARISRRFSPLLDPRVRFTRERVAYGSAYVPHRNLLLFAVACAYAESIGARTVWYGALSSDNDYWDADREFFRRLNAALALKPRSVRIETPLIGMDKDEALRLGDRLGVDHRRTYSCFVGGKEPCGRCPACRHRRNAYRKAGIRARDG